jgi:CPA2 family monovalent cation:H+ antiporter-2
VLSPAGEEIIGSGDELLVLGMPESIRGFRDWLLERASPQGEEPK